MSEKIKTSHPSYGLVSFSRIVGNPGRLFGSSLNTHQNYVILRIGQAERIYDNGRERFHGAGETVEVKMSSAQFAELITTMNSGVGTPCTISRIDGKSVGSPPDEPTESEHVKIEFEKDAENLVRDLRREREDIKELFLTKKNLGMHDRQQILGVLDKLITKIVSDMPFMLEQFSEATEKVVQHAKTEVDAFITSCALAEGIRSIMDRREPPALQEKNESEDNLPTKGNPESLGQESK